MSHIEIVAGGTRSRSNQLFVSALADFGYNILNVEGIFDIQNTLLVELLGNKRSLFVISPTVYEIYGRAIEQYMSIHFAPDQYMLSVAPSTENNKNLETVQRICAQAKVFNLDRDGCFVAIGGGIIMDMVGFAASMYRRGTKYIKVATTLLGQVDVSVGVKTGVNFMQSKNMLGTYYPAYATINDRLFLQTLPVRELRCGLSETIKMGLVCEASIIDHIEQFYQRFPDGNISNMDYDIFVAAMRCMTEELQPNLLELELERLVDFGHTFSMRFETHSEHKLLHGEAVAIDMAISCALSALMGYMKKQDCERAILLLKHAGLPIYNEHCCTVENLLESIEEVSLHRNAVNLVLPTSVGEGMFVKNKEELPPELLKRAIDLVKTFSSHIHQIEGGTENTLASSQVTAL